MSKIRICVKNKKPGLKICSPEVQFIRRVSSGGDLNDAVDRIADGKYFYEAMLYMNDHVDVDEDIREIIEGLDSLGLGSRILEILYDEEWDDLADENQAEISQQVLLNMLDGAVGNYS